MKDWELAEAKVRSAVGGKFTIGSGNKGQKGDIWTDDNVWMIEVKQTNNTKISVDSKWFKKLEAFKFKHELCLVIFFELRGYVYTYIGQGEVPNEWTSKAVHEKDLPSRLVSCHGGVWILQPWEYLYTLNEDGS